MIIINLTGQLGNQMFQYALGRKLELIGKRVRYYTGYYETHPNHDFALPRIFNIEIHEATKRQVLACREDLHRPIDRLRRKVFGRHEHVFSEIGADSLAFKPEVFEFRQGLIDGYWQSEKYFADIASIIKSDFTFPKPSEKNRRLVEEMERNNAVSIHVRRGDYLRGFPVMDESYYRPSMAYFLERYIGIHFYVFSNDIPWCREHLKGKEITFVDSNTGKDSPFDMWLMAQCKHNIIANSSFSWWGAWLNQNKNKEIIAPKRWFDSVKTPDVYCPNWIVL